MQWIYLISAGFFAIVALYLVFTNFVRRKSADYIFYKLPGNDKITTESNRYQWALRVSYVIPFLSVVLIILVFQNIIFASFIFILIIIIGSFVLLTLDKVFELRGQAIIFAGYHAKWGKIRSIKWGKNRNNKKILIMELAKGQKIKTSIKLEHTSELEETLKNYVYFEK